jgi:hypothetical protein
MSELPPCGLYKTTVPLGEHIPAGRLVYFHNHGEPGPGVYLPGAWRQNRAQWQDRGHVIPDSAWAGTLEPLPPEGLYRVVETFTCCEKNCRTFEPELLVQLGYDGQARPILFLPELSERGFAVPETGQIIDAKRLAKLAALKVVSPAATAPPSGAGFQYH